MNLWMIYAILALALFLIASGCLFAELRWIFYALQERNAHALEQNELLRDVIRTMRNEQAEPIQPVKIVRPLRREAEYVTRRSPRE